MLTSALKTCIANAYSAAGLGRSTTSSGLTLGLWRALSTQASPLLHFCVVGTGPAGFYTADRLLKQFNDRVCVTLVDRLPTPFGLVRSGVAPDHSDTKNVINQFTSIGRDPRVSFLGNVSVGVDVSLEELQRLHHGVVIATGAESDRRLGIPGEEGPGVFSAREFVWWYNGHPDAARLPVSLSGVTSVAICGIGNVALDCARVLLRRPDAPPLATSDMAAHALHALRTAAPGITHVHLVARRGPVQAACTPKELKEIVSEPGVTVSAAPGQLAVSDADRAQMKAVRSKRRVYDIISQAVAAPPAGDGVTGGKHLQFQFYRQPKQVMRDPVTGAVTGLQVERTALQAGPGPGAAVTAVGTGQLEVIPAQLILVSIGYKSLPVPGAPFDAGRGTIPHAGGRVLAPSLGGSSAASVAPRDSSSGAPAVIQGLYVCGWIKRGPTGIIGTNLADAEDTVSSVVQDAQRGALPHPGPATPRGKLGAEGLAALCAARGVQVVTFPDWERISEREMEAGQAGGKLREKMVSVPDMLRAAVGAP